MERSHRLHARFSATARTKVLVVGLGPIGVELSRLLLTQDDRFRFLGAIDVSPKLVRRPLRDVLGSAAPKGSVRHQVPPAPAGSAIAFLTTTSSMQGVAASLFELLQRGYHVVSSTEELSYPFLRAPDLARRVDRAAKNAGRCVVGTGINPGFAMDVWPLVFASNAQSLEHVEVVRVVDASTRRAPLQRKVGSGMTVAGFEALAEEGKIGHVGLVESCVHLADLLGWPLDRVDETLRPKRASKRIRTPHFDVPPGRVCGILHRAVGWQGKTERIVLDLSMYLGAPQPRDEVTLRSHPPLHCIVPGGFHGDPTTASQLVAAAARIAGMPPGLHLASELPAPRRPAARVQLSLASPTPRKKHK